MACSGGRVGPWTYPIPPRLLPPAHPSRLRRKHTHAQHRPKNHGCECLRLSLSLSLSPSLASVSVRYTYPKGHEEFFRHILLPSHNVHPREHARRLRRRGDNVAIILGVDVDDVIVEPEGRVEAGKPWLYLFCQDRIESQKNNGQRLTISLRNRRSAAEVFTWVVEPPAFCKCLKHAVSIGETDDKKTRTLFAPGTGLSGVTGCRIGSGAPSFAHFHCASWI